MLFRDGEGRAHALQDRCAHRQAPLSAGRTCREGVECPYHGWVYDGAGRLARIPSLPDDAAAQTSAGARGASGPDADTGVETCAVTGISVPAYAVRERQGFIWVASLPGPAPDSEPMPFPHLDEPGWTSFIMRTRFEADVQTCLENFLDCPHATFVHRYWFRAPLARPVDAIVTRCKDGVQASFAEEPRAKSLVWWLLSPRGGEMEHTDRFIAPARSQVDYGFPNGWRYSITSSCTEIESRLTEVHTVMSFRTGAVGPLVRLYFEPLSRWIIRQDVRIIAKRARNLDAFDVAGLGERTESSTQADLLGPVIRRWREELATGNADGCVVPERTVRILL